MPIHHVISTSGNQDLTQVENDILLLEADVDVLENEVDANETNITNNTNNISTNTTNLANTVKLTTNQTIGGEKTFTDESNHNDHLNIRNKEIRIWDNTNVFYSPITYTNIANMDLVIRKTDTVNISGLFSYVNRLDMKTNNPIRLYDVTNSNTVDLTYSNLSNLITNINNIVYTDTQNNFTALQIFSNNINLLNNNNLYLYDATNSNVINFNYTDYNTLKTSVAKKDDNNTFQNINTHQNNIVIESNKYLQINNADNSLNQVLTYDRLVNLQTVAYTHLSTNNTFLNVNTFENITLIKNNKRIDFYDATNSTFTSFDKAKVDKIDNAVLTNQNATLTSQYTFTQLNGVNTRNINMNQNAELKMLDSNNQNPAYLRYSKLQEIEAGTVPVVSTWTNLSLTSGYIVKTGSGRSNNVSYRTINYGSNGTQVFLRGSIQPSIGSFGTTGIVNLLNLPSGARPSTLLDLMSVSGNERGSFAYILIYSGGNVSVLLDKVNDGNDSSSVNPIEYVSLDGLSFWTN